MLDSIHASLTIDSRVFVDDCLVAVCIIYLHLVFDFNLILMLYTWLCCINTSLIFLTGFAKRIFIDYFRY